MRIRLPWLTLALALGVLALARPPSGAQILSGTIGGTVTAVADGVPGIVVGDVVSGTYSYDSSILSDDGLGRQANPLTAFMLSVGRNPRVFTLADLQPGLAARERVPGFSTPTVDSLEFFFHPDVLAEVLGQPVEEQVIRNSPPQTWGGETGGVTVLRFDFAATPPVPEPSSLAVLLVGALSALFAVRRRRPLRA